MSFKGGTTAGRGKVAKVAKAATVVKVKGKANTEPKNPKDAKELFLKRIKMCSVTYDYSDDAKAKSERLTALQELREFLNDTKNAATYALPHSDIVLEMIRKNIFQPLPMDKKSAEKLSPSETGVEDQHIVIDPAWPHLQGVYEFFFELIVCEVTDVKSIMVYVTDAFVQEFLQLFDSEELSERDYLKNILHRLYAKLVPRRKMIRKAINDCF